VIEQEAAETKLENKITNTIIKIMLIAPLLLSIN
jgi:hypothetical protein